MSRPEATVLASRTLGLLLIVWALVDLSYLPRDAYSYVHYINLEAKSAGAVLYRHYYLLDITFRITRIVGLFLMGSWLRQCGPDVQRLFWPGESEASPETN